MTLKYESEILFDLMKRDGDDTPSDVLPYESELKEKYLHQVEGAYPKLQDYRPEWLNYNLNAHLPADFPVESVSNVTNATFENVVPYAYGSAILKGQTLVNVLSSSNVKHIGTSTVNIEYSVLPNPNNKLFIQIRFNQLPTLVDGANRFLKLEIYDDNVTKGSIELPISNMITGQTQKFILDVFNGEPTRKTFTSWIPRFASGTLDYDIVLIEYQQGIENWDIPYFTGMQSVKMPVLTTTGKNLCDINKYIDGGISDGRMIINKNIYRSYYMKCKPSTTYVISVENSNNRFGVGSSNVFSEDKTFALNSYWIGYGNDVTGQTLQHTFTTTEKDKYLYVYVANNGVFNPNIRVQVEEGSSATTYEPYKSNILTVNEEVTLRGIGEVQDTLDCLTGKVTQRISEIVLNGSEETWGSSYETTNAMTFKLPLRDCIYKGQWTNNTLKNDYGFKQVGWYYIYSDKLDEECYAVGDNKYLHIRVLKSRLNSVDVNGFKSFLSANPITIQYVLATESIKTVDLTVTDQDGNTTSIIRPIEGTMHVSTSSQTIPPLLDMSVPVEATSQNLMSFVNILEEE